MIFLKKNIAFLCIAKKDLVVQNVPTLSSTDSVGKVSAVDLFVHLSHADCCFTII